MSQARRHIQFSHANGFPAGTYRKFFEALSDRYEIHAVERIGHDPRYPVTDSWPHLLEELLAQIDARAEPSILVGHSLGGLLSMMAGYARPEKISAVVMLDSPVVSFGKAQLLAAAKRLNLDERFSPARPTRNRRTSWPSRDAALAHFASRDLFRRFDPEVLQDYVNAGLVETDDGATLFFNREIEYRIYRTLPHHLHRLARVKPSVPFGFIGGTESAELKLAGTAASLAFIGPHFRWIAGGHLFPMEKPVESAQLLKELLRSMGTM